MAGLSLGDPRVSLGLGLLTAWDQGRKEQEANAANAQRLHYVGRGLANFMLPQNDPNYGAVNIQGYDIPLPTFNPNQELTRNYQTDSRLAAADARRGLAELTTMGREAYGRQSGVNARTLADFTGMSDRLLTGAKNRTDAILSDFDAGAGRIEQGYQDRYSRGMKMLEGLGDQEKADIRNDYGARAGSIKANLAARGMGNTTAVDSMLQGNLREQTADLGRANDRIRQQKVSTDAGLSGDYLGSIANNVAARTQLKTGLTGDEFNLRSGLGQQGFNLRSSQEQGLADLLGRVDESRFNYGENARANQRQLTSNYGAQRWGVGMDAARSLLNTIAGVQDNAPDQSYTAQIINTLGRGSGAQLFQQHAESPGGMASWFNAGTGAGMGAAAGGLIGLMPGMSLPLSLALGAGIGGGAGLMGGGLGGR